MQIYEGEIAIHVNGYARTYYTETKSGKEICLNDVLEKIYKQNVRITIESLDPNVR